ncbi:uncharacterized protein LOC111862949 isoform X2 [Cryptotermes secundus]|uniref:uncharacterized protein LOC111862949 isoform X2 n=1 Tax=Cryptotermes secundus TaxID=105785 RepID=UPI000CD7CEDA|nr:uncharacterized protein LOC111862949 isoform X2 [Cryptotermes secundus]
MPSKMAAMEPVPHHYTSTLKFDISLLTVKEDNVTSQDAGVVESSLVDSSLFAVPCMKQASSVIQFTSLPDSNLSLTPHITQSENMPSTNALSQLLLQPTQPREPEAVTGKCSSDASTCEVLESEENTGVVKATGAPVVKREFSFI